MKVKVWNDGPLDRTEEYLGNTFTIPRGEFVEMERSKAVKFVSQFQHFSREGEIKELNYKMLRIEIDPEEDAARKDQPFRYAASDNTKFRTVEGMKKYEDSLTVRTGSNVGKKRTG